MTFEVNFENILFHRFTLHVTCTSHWKLFVALRYSLRKVSGPCSRAACIFCSVFVVHSFLTCSQNVDGGGKNNRQDSIDEVAIHLRFLDFMSFEVVVPTHWRLPSFPIVFPTLYLRVWGATPESVFLEHNSRYHQPCWILQDS